MADFCQRDYDLIFLYSPVWRPAPTIRETLISQVNSSAGQQPAAQSTPLQGEQEGGQEEKVITTLKSFCLLFVLIQLEGTFDVEN